MGICFQIPIFYYPPRSKPDSHTCMVIWRLQQSIGNTLAVKPRYLGRVLLPMKAGQTLTKQGAQKSVGQKGHDNGCQNNSQQYSGK